MRFPGFVTHLVLYVVAVMAMYSLTTKEVTGKFSERQTRDFHVAAVETGKEAGPVPVSLAQIEAGKVDLSSTSFLLPPGNVTMNVQGGDLHQVTVVERHADWQLVEYKYGNTHDSTSRYRAFKDRIEPVSYRVTMDPGLVLNAIVLLVPVWIIASLINAALRRMAK